MERVIIKKRLSCWFRIIVVVVVLASSFKLVSHGIGGIGVVVHAWHISPPPLLTLSFRSNGPHHSRSSRWRPSTQPLARQYASSSTTTSTIGSRLGLGATTETVTNSNEHNSNGAWLPTIQPEEDSLRKLYPPSTASTSGRLAVDETHILGYQVYGNFSSTSRKLKALFLHGGPGAGCFPNHARFFNLEKYYQAVVLLDQRGCGTSTPTSCLVNQTLDHLVEDCERLRTHLQYDQWDVVLGGSWGSTVAVAYAQTYPTSIRAVILRGVCLLRSQEVDWLFAAATLDTSTSTSASLQHHAGAWESFANAVNVNAANVHDGNTMLEYPRQVLHEYYQRFIWSRNDTERWNAARAWMKWEMFNSVASHPQIQIPKATTSNTSSSRSTNLGQSTADTRPTTSPVAVFHNDGSSWTYQTASGKEIPSHQLAVDLNLDPSADETSLRAAFRRGLSHSSTTYIPPPRKPWPFPDIPEGNSSNFPVQAMLTCFYSTNDDYCRNGRNLLDDCKLFSSSSTTTTTRIPYCIAIQGGSDAICPPDTALDLLEVWPGAGRMELRMPVYAGHSMYDPYITHEIVQATDRLAIILMDVGTAAAAARTR